MMNKLFKGMLIVAMFFVFNLIVNAECPNVENNDDTANPRILSCDVNKQTTTTYKYPDAGQVQVFSNDLCTIKCNESVLFLIDKAKNVRAGMGFNFPLYVAAQRTCNATYNYKEFDEALRALVTKRDDPAFVSEKGNTTNQISNMLQEKAKCDDWLGTASEKGNNYKKYGFSGYAVSLSVETSKGFTDIGYSFKPSADYESTVNKETSKYDSCDLKDENAKCTTVSDTVSSWTELARVDGRFTMNDRYIEKYTGKVYEIKGGNTCNAKDIYFTSFNELTRPISTNRTDKGYSLKLTANNIGNNIDPTGDKWKLTVDCWYSLKNLIFPQTSTTETDEYYEKYGGTAFMYRQIDLEVPFPNRTAGENWKGKEQLITGVDTGTVAYKEGKYTINLDTPEKIERVKKYNETNPYEAFVLNSKEKSTFIIQNKDIVTRK